MLIDIRDFPLDTNNALGSLRSNLIKSLHMAGTSNSTAVLLDKTLAVGSKLVRKIKAENKKKAAAETKRSKKTEAKVKLKENLKKLGDYSGEIRRLERVTADEDM